MKKFVLILTVLAIVISIAACSTDVSGSSSAQGSNPPGKPSGGPGGNGGPGGGSSSSVTYAATEEITSSTAQADRSYNSTTSDVSSLMISTSGAVSISNPTVTKSGDSNGGDNCNFYGQNAAVLVKGGSTATITGGTISSDATGANGVFLSLSSSNSGATPLKEPKDAPNAKLTTLALSNERASTAIIFLFMDNSEYSSQK